MFKIKAVLGLCGTYVRLMLVYVWILDTILGPDLSHFELMLSQEWRVELMLSQERRVPVKPSPGPKGTHRFWIMSG